MPRTISMGRIDGLQEEIVGLISLNLGPETAHLYNNFFDKEDAKTILESASTLLRDFLGKQKADSELDPIYKKFNVPRA